jgi:hypothetical protein
MLSGALVYTHAVVSNHCLLSHVVVISKFVYRMMYLLFAFHGLYPRALSLSAFLLSSPLYFTFTPTDHVTMLQNKEKRVRLLIGFR